MVDIIKSLKARGPTIERIRVFPRHDELEMRCGNCHSMQFRVHVKPLPKNVGGCRITEVVCATCLKYIPIDTNAVVQGHGKPRMRKETKNGRYS